MAIKVKIFPLFFLFFLICSLYHLQAKSLKIATVDMPKIFENFKEKKEADRQIIARKDKLKKDLSKLKEQIATLEDEYEKNSSTQTLKEIASNKELLVTFKHREEAVIKQTEDNYLHNLYGEIYDKISLIAQKFDYDIILRKKDLIYAKKTKDITEFVISEINKL
ncbi:MAG: OmpH family outer membrane protein [bacterium]|nr:OmpH family outer membrane protein [bacterium]